jgi:hypothetical protein
VRTAIPKPVRGPSRRRALTILLALLAVLGATPVQAGGGGRGGSRVALTSRNAQLELRQRVEPKQRSKGLINRLLQRKPKPTVVVPVEGGSRKVVPLTRAGLRKQFGKAGAAQINHALRQGRWRPTEQWLATEGKKYGRLIIVSDLHPSTGRDPITRRVNPAEDFKPNEQEVDFLTMMEKQWGEAVDDGRNRTLVLNGDTLEFMQTERAPTGGSFTGPSDQFGPLNTPHNVAAKLEAIWNGHPTLFGTYAEHVARGHRLVLIPGNHDRQLIHPTVLKQFKRLLIRDVARRIAADETYQPGAGRHKRRKLALVKAKALVKESFEFHPYLFMVGDVVARHGNETDRYNQFSTPFGEYYHPGGKDEPIESALGDYVVKALVNKAERSRPWTDNASSRWAVARAVIGAVNWNPIKLAKVIGYLVTREGADLKREAVARRAERLRKDLRREIRHRDLLTKFNEIRPADEQLGEDELLTMLVGYEGEAAKGSLAQLQKGSSAWSRIKRVLRGFKEFFGPQGKPEMIEQRMTDRLFAEYVSTVAVGHDHIFRFEPRITMGKNGAIGRAEVLDPATWIDWVPGERDRELGFTPTARRGVILVDFEKNGSHAKLMNWDPDRGLQLVSELEDEAEAAEM